MYEEVDLTEIMVVLMAEIEAELTYLVTVEALCDRLDPSEVDRAIEMCLSAT